MTFTFTLIILGCLIILFFFFYNCQPSLFCLNSLSHSFIFSRTIIYIHILELHTLSFIYIHIIYIYGYNMYRYIYHFILSSLCIFNIFNSVLHPVYFLLIYFPLDYSFLLLHLNLLLRLLIEFLISVIAFLSSVFAVFASLISLMALSILLFIFKMSIIVKNNIWVMQQAES